MDVAFESFDVRVRVSVGSADLLEHVIPLLPPHARPCPLETTSESFGLFAEPDGRYRFERTDSPVSKRLELPFALELMQAQLRIYVGMNTPARIFIHAGVVERDGSAIVIPGSSFSGKTTLVRALVEAGARYYSDDYAVIDDSGLVHPFAKPLSIRDADEIQVDHSVERIGGTAGDEPIPIAAAVFTAYRPGADWRPGTLSHGNGVLRMFEHALTARARAQESLQVLNVALRDAVLLDGERGDATELVAPLLSAPLGQLASAVGANLAG